MMIWDMAQYANPGRHEENQDTIRVTETDTRVIACICDGLGGMGSGKDASLFCAEAVIDILEESCGVPDEHGFSNTVLKVHKALLALKQENPALKQARSTVAAIAVENDKLVWANVGDTRLYLFRGMDIERCSVDHSAAYIEYEHGALTYGGIRMADTRGVLTACLGDERDFEPYTGEAQLLPGDGLLLCTDGFWQYVLETEMGADLCKSETAQQWLSLMLNRLVGRSMLDGDNLTAFALRIKEDEPNGY